MYQAPKSVVMNQRVHYFHGLDLSLKQFGWLESKLKSEISNLQSRTVSFRNLLLYFSLSGSFLCTDPYTHTSRNSDDRW